MLLQGKHPRWRSALRPASAPYRADGLLRGRLKHPSQPAQEGAHRATGQMVELGGLQPDGRHCRDLPPSAFEPQLAALGVNGRNLQVGIEDKVASLGEELPARRVAGALLVRHRRYGREEGDLAARPVSLVRIAGRRTRLVSLNPEIAGPPLGTDGLAAGCVDDWAEKVRRTREPGARHGLL